MQAIIRQSQWLADVALQECGAAEAVYDMALINNLSITNELPTGSSVELTDVYNNSIVEYYRINGIMPATAFDDGSIPEGIDYWMVKSNFKIS